MFKNYFKGIEGIADYPVISLVLFFLFFVMMIAWWMRLSKKNLEELSRLPFAAGETNVEKNDSQINSL